MLANYEGQSVSCQSVRNQKRARIKMITQANCETTTDKNEYKQERSKLNTSKQEAKQVNK